MKKLAILLSIITLVSCRNFGKNNKSEPASADNSVSQSTTSDNKDTTKAMLVKVDPIPAGWKTYSHDNYVIHYPPKWTLILDDTTLELQISSPDSASGNNLNLIKKNMAGMGFSLDQMPEVVATSKNDYPDFTLVSSVRVKYGSMECQKVIFKATEGGLYLEFEQRYFMINDYLYILTLTCMPDDWDKSAKIGEQIMYTFEVKN